MPLTNTQMAQCFNEWMRRFIEEPESFAREFEQVNEFLAEEADGKEPSYGETSAAYMNQIAGELSLEVDAQITEAEAKRRTAVAKMIISEIQVGEALHEGSIGPYLGGYPGEGMVWHHKHGWLQPTKYLEAAKADVEAGDLTREDVAAVLVVDLAEVDADNARDRARQDQMSPGTWTTLPDGVGVDGWMFDITDPDDKIVIASADTQTDGTEVGFHTFPTEADNAVSKGIWALITRNFSLASVRDMELAEKALKADPERLASIKSSVEGLQKTLANDGKASIYLQVGGECRELHGDADAVEQLLRQLEFGTRLQSECIRRDEAGCAYLYPSATVS